MPDPGSEPCACLRADSVLEECDALMASFGTRREVTSAQARGQRRRAEFSFLTKKTRGQHRKPGDAQRAAETHIRAVWDGQGSVCPCILPTFIQVVCLSTEFSWGFPGVLVAKNPPANAKEVRDTRSVPGSGRSPGGGHGSPLQYSYLENPMDRGAWQTTVHEVTKSQIQRK